jgi:hypothetical protein
MQHVIVGADGEPGAMINRPQRNRKVKYWIRFVCEMATKDHTFLIFSCDTAEQAKHAAKLAAKHLPHHRRVAMERMYDPATRATSALS